jgi:hypothetical protein
MANTKRCQMDKIPHRSPLHFRLGLAIFILKRTKSWFSVKQNSRWPGWIGGGLWKPRVSTAAAVASCAGEAMDAVMSCDAAALLGAGSRYTAMGTTVPRGGAPGLGLPLRDAPSTSPVVSLRVSPPCRCGPHRRWRTAILRYLRTVSGSVPATRPAARAGFARVVGVEARCGRNGSMWSNAGLHPLDNGSGVRVKEDGRRRTFTKRWQGT